MMMMMMKLNNYTVLLMQSHESVVDMFFKFSASKKSVWLGAGNHTFAGLRKSSTTVSDFQLAAVKDVLQLDSTSSITCQSFDRILINDKVFSTDSYASNFRRNNSFVLLRNGCFASINHVLLSAVAIVSVQGVHAVINNFFCLWHVTIQAVLSPCETVMLALTYKKAQLTQRERTTAVHVRRPTANKCKVIDPSNRHWT